MSITTTPSHVSRGTPFANVLLVAEASAIAGDAA